MDQPDSIPPLSDRPRIDPWAVTAWWSTVLLLVCPTVVGLQVPLIKHPTPGGLALAAGIQLIAAAPISLMITHSWRRIRGDDKNLRGTWLLVVTAAFWLLNCAMFFIAVIFAAVHISSFD